MKRAALSILASLSLVLGLFSAMPSAGAAGVTTVEVRSGIDDLYYDGGAEARDYDILYLSGDGRYCALVRFTDLSSIPDGATIASARLMLFKAFIRGSIVISAHRFLAPWNEAKAPPPTYDPTPADTIVISGSGDAPGYVEWDITPLVAGWKEGQYANYGVILRGKGDTSIIFEASESIWVPYRGPKLRIEYTWGPAPLSTTGGIEVAVITPVGDAVAGAEVSLVNAVSTPQGAGGITDGMGRALLAGVAEGSYVAIARQDAIELGRSPPLTVRGGRTTSTTVITPAKGSLRVSAYCSDGTTPLPEVTARLYNQGGTLVKEAATDAKGEAIFSLWPTQPSLGEHYEARLYREGQQVGASGTLSIASASTSPVKVLTSVREPPRPRTVFSDSAEPGGTAWTATGLWQRSQHRSRSPSYAWYYGQKKLSDDYVVVASQLVLNRATEELRQEWLPPLIKQEESWNYDTGEVTSGSLTSASIDLTRVVEPALSFYSWHNTYSLTGGGRDLKLVEVSTDDGVTWAEVFKVTSEPATWVQERVDLSNYADRLRASQQETLKRKVQERVDLSNYADKTFRIRFRFDSVTRADSQYEGWYLGDINITGKPFASGIEFRFQSIKVREPQVISGKVPDSITFIGHLMSWGKPWDKKTMSVEDPVKQKKNSITTDSQGLFVYTTDYPSQGGFYAFTFYTDEAQAQVVLPLHHPVDSQAQGRFAIPGRSLEVGNTGASLDLYTSVLTAMTRGSGSKLTPPTASQAKGPLDEAFTTFVRWHKETVWDYATKPSDIAFAGVVLPNTPWPGGAATENITWPITLSRLDVSLLMGEIRDLARQVIAASNALSAGQKSQALSVVASPVAQICTLGWEPGKGVLGTQGDFVWLLPLFQEVTPIEQSIDISGDDVRIRLADEAGNTIYLNLWLPRFSISGRVSASGHGLGWAMVATEKGQFAITDEEGNYTVQGVAPGDYTVTAQVPPYLTEPVSVHLPGDSACRFSACGVNFLAKSPSKILFRDSAVSAEGWQASGLWHRTTHRSYSAPNAWYCGRENAWNYKSDQPTPSQLVSPPIDLSGVTKATLSFQRWFDTEVNPDYDLKLVGVSTDGGASWIQQRLSGQSRAWVREQIDLSPYAGQVVRISFRLEPGDSLFNEYEGWYLDDIMVVGEES